MWHETRYVSVLPIIPPFSTTSLMDSELLHKVVGPEFLSFLLKQR